MEQKSKKIIYCVEFLAISLNKHYILIDIENGWDTQVEVPLSTNLLNQTIEEEYSTLHEKTAQWIWPAEEEFEIVKKDLKDFYEISNDELAKKIFSIYIRHLTESMAKII